MLAAATELLLQHGSLRLDMRDVTFIDSTGLALIVRLLRWCKRHQVPYGAITIGGPLQDSVGRVLRIAGLDQLLTIVDVPDASPPW